MGAGYYKRLCGMALALMLALALGSQAMGEEIKGEDKRRVVERVRSLQAPFVENRGQVADVRVKYYAKTSGGTVFVTGNGEIVYSLPIVPGRDDEGVGAYGHTPLQGPKSEEEGGRVIEERLLGAAIGDVRGEEESATRVSYFKGNDPSKWLSGITAYNLVSLGEVYPGIELKVKAYGSNMEKLFRVKPGADPGMIKIRLEGVGARRAVPLPLEGRGGLSVNDKGELEVETGPRLKQAGAGHGGVKFTKRVAYQEEDGSRKYIEASYEVRGNEYWFELGEYDRDRELVIDPFLVSTFVGGAERDFSHSIALDASGDVYVAGYTNSSDFPTTVGAYDRAFNGGGDAFVVRADAYLLTNSCTPGDSEGDRGHP